MPSTYDRVTERIVKALESGNPLPWRKPWSNPVPCNASGRKYNGLNRLVLSCTEFPDHRWLTFRQALDLGGNVRKGEKGTPVLLWKQLELQLDDEDTSKKPGLLCQSFTVFNVAQCDGIDLPELHQTQVTSSAIFDKVQSALKNFESCPPIRYGKTSAYYSLRRDEVHMPHPNQFESEAAWANVLLHELAHSTGHSSRLGRFAKDGSPTKDKLRYAFEELVAEISASFVLAELGIACPIESDNSHAYIESWLRGFREKTFFLSTAASRAQRAADMLLGQSS